GYRRERAFFFFFDAPAFFAAPARAFFFAAPERAFFAGGRALRFASPAGFAACGGGGMGWSMAPRFFSVSKKDTYLPTPGISLGSPSTSPPAASTFAIAARTSSTAMTMFGYCAGQSDRFGNRPPLIRPDSFGGPARPTRPSSRGRSCPSPPRAHACPSRR